MTALNAKCLQSLTSDVVGAAHELGPDLDFNKHEDWRAFLERLKQHRPPLHQELTSLEHEDFLTVATGAIGRLTMPIAPYAFPILPRRQFPMFWPLAFIAGLCLIGGVLAYLSQGR